MYSKTMGVPLAGVFGAIVAIGLLAPAPAAAQPLKKGEVFPNFTEPDLLTGKPIDLQSFRGKVVLVDFWATWCGPCVAEIPNIRKAFEKYHKDGFEVISVSLDGEKDLGKCKQLIKDKKMDWYHIADGKFWKAKLAVKHKISGIPVSALLNKEGKILTLNLRGEDFSKSIAEALGVKYEPPPGEAEAKAKLVEADQLREDGKRDEALKLYDEIVAKYPEASGAKLARERAADLRDELSQKQ